jgi:hypothetical protein
LSRYRLEEEEEEVVVEGATVANRVTMVEEEGAAGNEGPRLLAVVPPRNQIMGEAANGLEGRRLRQRLKDAAMAAAVVVVVVVVLTEGAVDLRSSTVLWLLW